MSRRRFLANGTVGAGFASLAAMTGRPAPAGAQVKGREAAAHADAGGAEKDQARIAITMDLEMARNFPRWEDTEWDYQKGNLNQAAKEYAVRAADRVRAHGGTIHFFVVGQVFEQANVDWLKQIVEQGHPVGNHTYDHVYVLAKKREEIQYRFRRAPWLIEGKPIAQVIRDNIRLTNVALKERLGIEPAGFRTPGGFSTGLSGRPDIQSMLLELGFDWVSCKYPTHPYSKPHEAPTEEVLNGIVRAQATAQPLIYPTGLIDIPMSPISDIGAFRTCRWRLEHFLQAIERAVTWTIEQRATFDFLAHPSCLGVVDPQLKTVDLICHLVKQAGDRAAIVDLGTLARRA
ncbi:MAG: polysaccharide deacetylase family protein [Pirellulales bacterium]